MTPEKLNRLGRRFRTVVATLALLMAAGPATAQSYRVVEVEPLPGTVEAIFTDLNNSLQGVGVTTIVTPCCSNGPPFVWNLDGTRPFPISNVVGNLAINNKGVIVGTQSVGTRYQVFSLRGSEYRQLPTPAAEHVTVVEVTDSGVILLSASEGGSAGAWAIYNEQLYDLRQFGSIVTIGEDGTLGGSRGGRPYLRALHGRETVPWSSSAGVAVIGPGGHFAGGDFPTLGRCCYFGDATGAVTTFMPQTSLFTTSPWITITDINRRGDLIGQYRAVCGSCTSAAFSAFLYRNGQTIDLTQSVKLARGRLIDAQRILDTGVIAATAAVDRSGGLGLDRRQVVLLPDDGLIPEPPAGVTFAIAGRTVTLQWQPSAGAVDYIVQAGRAPAQSDFYDQSVGSHLVVGGVVPSGRYYVRVLARSGAGTSRPSAEVIIDVP